MIVVEVVENKPAPCTIGTVLIFKKRTRTAYSKLLFASVFCLITEEKTLFSRIIFVFCIDFISNCVFNFSYIKDEITCFFIYKDFIYLFYMSNFILKQF
jgi:hypothetical protein